MTTPLAEELRSVKLPKSVPVPTTSNAPHEAKPPQSDELPTTDDSIIVPGIEYDPKEDIYEFERSLADKFNIKFLKQVKGVAYYLSSVGLEFDEACLVARIEPEEMRRQIQVHPEIQTFFDLKQLEFKKDMMTTIANAARAGNEKLATWLLAQKYPNQFNRKAGSTPGGDGGDDIIAAAIEFVRTTGDSSPLVTTVSGKAMIVKKGAGSSVRNLGDVLT